MQKEIIAAIAEYLYHFTESTNDFKKVRFLKAVRHDKTREDFLQEIAAEIAAAIAPQISKLQDACKEVVKGYEGDGMENMYPRDEVFYRVCKEALE